MSAVDVQTDPLPQRNRRFAAAHSKREWLTDVYPIIAQVVSAVFGVVFATLGVLGLAKAGISPFASTSGTSVWLLSVNPLLSVINLGLGLGGLVSASRSSWARRYASWAYALCLIVFLCGVYMTADSSRNYLGMNGWTLGTYLVAFLLVHW